MQYAILTINKAHRYYATETYLFSASIDMKHSVFLSNILSEVNPGNEYSITFTHRRPNLTKDRAWYYGSDGKGLPDFS